MKGLDKEIHIFAEDVDPDTMRQFESAMERDFSVKGVLLPDAHLGYSLPIGAVVATDGVILPAWVGYDIGCGMLAALTPLKKEDVIPHREKIFYSMYRAVPTGFAHNRRPEPWDYKDIPMTPTLAKIWKRENGLKQIGTLGGGNHFIEVDHDEQGRVWVVVHSGSRHIGWNTAATYMAMAAGSDRPREGHYGFRADSDRGRDYITDMNFCLAFALANRRKILDRVLREIYYYVRPDEKPETLHLVNRHHNHAEFKNGLWIHRKGATHAEKGMEGVIPGNMRDGSFIVVGKGYEKSLCSSSHGAGRAVSRREAKRTITMDQFRKDMEGITSRVRGSILDEAPGAYKNIFEVLERQKEMVEVIHHLKPIINVKG